MLYGTCLVIRPTIALFGFDDGFVFGFIVGGLVACRGTQLATVQLGNIDGTIPVHSSDEIVYAYSKTIGGVRERGEVAW